MFGSFAEIERISLPSDRKSTYRNVVDAVEPCRELISPRDVVSSTSREDLDVVMAVKMLRHISGVKLGSSIEFRSITLDNDRQFHCI